MVNCIGIPLDKTFSNEIEKILILEHDSTKMKTYVNDKNNKEPRGEKGQNIVVGTIENSNRN